MKLFLTIICILFTTLVFASQVEDMPVFTDSLLDAVVESESTKKDILLVFGADWCKFCKIMKKDIYDNNDQLKHLIISYVDVDQEPELAKEYRVKQLPDYMIIRDRREIKRKVGYKNFESLRKWIMDDNK